jgi:hypothetical protein
MEPSQNAKYAVVVHYTGISAKHREFVNALEKELRCWISKRPGFISGTVYTGIDEEQVVVQSLWIGKDDSLNFMDCPEAKGLWHIINSSGAQARQSALYSIGETVLKPSLAEAGA